jgi:tetratricopeptide (TPR) repeat protein
MIDETRLETYRKQQQQIAVSDSDGLSKEERHLQVIEGRLSDADTPAAWQNFLKGEQAFYKGNPELALKHYLQASSIPHYPFYCYRASAKISKERGDFAKALGFTKKALTVFPDDDTTLSLHEELEALDQLTSTCHNQTTQAAEYCLALNENEERQEMIEQKANGNKEHFANPGESWGSEVSLPIDAASSALDELQNTPATSVEKEMNTESDIFSSPKSNGVNATETLTMRLYPQDPSQVSKNLFPGKTEKEHGIPLDKTPKGDTKNNEAAIRTLASELGIDDTGTQTLEQRIKGFQKNQACMIEEYQEGFRKRSKLADSFLSVLQGWNAPAVSDTAQGNSYLRRLFLAEQARKTSGGYFIRWNGKGIVINPGTGFLQTFHERGMHIRDIDIILVTGDSSDSYGDVKEIYDLNYQLNKVNPELQIIRYYLNSKAFQDLSGVLKPNFKQERNTIHSLEMFVDSPDVEKTELCEGVILHYFVASTRDSMLQSAHNKDDANDKLSSTLGIRLELKSTAGYDKSSVRIGYVSGTAWSPLLAHHLGACDILLTGFGNTCSNDYQRLHYNQDSLGYYGNLTLLEEVAPRLMLCGEFGGREGDVRLEVVQKMRQDYVRGLRGGKAQPVVLPADTGLYLDLKNFAIRCSVSHASVDPALVKVVKTAEAFGRLHYLSPVCCY